MGCGCGGRKSNVRSNAIRPPVPGSVNARQVQTQTSQRQALAKAAREKLQQNSTSQQRNALGGKDDIEKRKRILVSLRNRKRQG
jgi:hypothetical protein